MVERRKELDKRYQRKRKMFKLKAKLATAKDEKEKEKVLEKIRKISPWWEMEQQRRQEQMAAGAKA